MNKIILLGHASSGLEKVEALLLASGMQTALPSQRDNLMPADIVQTLCQAHQIAEVNEVLTEDDFSPVKAGAIWNGLALDLMLGNLHQPLWGWADTRNIYWLNYWSELDPHATFVMVYDHPCKALQTMAHQLIDKPQQMEITRLLENWQAYNGAMLRFYSRFPSRCLLVNASSAREQLEAYLGQLGTQLHGKVPKLDGETVASLETNGNLAPPLQGSLSLAISEVPEIASASVMEWFGGTSDLDKHLLNQLLQDHPVSLQIFAELEAASTVKIAASAQTQLQALPAPKQQELEEENDLLLMQLHQVQEELERYYLENQSLKKNQAKPKERFYGAGERIQQQLTYHFPHQPL
jgi:hypothetical protein